MRIDPGILLVLIALMLPFIVQIRTVAGFVGIEVSVAQNATIGLLAIGALVLWALLPDDERTGPKANGGNS